jgi:hypothetical protein
MQLFPINLLVSRYNDAEKDIKHLEALLSEFKKILDAYEQIARLDYGCSIAELRGRLLSGQQLIPIPDGYQGTDCTYDSGVRVYGGEVPRYDDNAEF